MHNDVSGVYGLRRRHADSQEKEEVMPKKMRSSTDTPKGRAGVRSGMSKPCTACPVCANARRPAKRAQVKKK